MQLDANNEPFIPLPAPHNNIILTPPRFADADAAIACLNDPTVYMNLSGPPFPYTQENSKEWTSILSKATSDALKEFRAAQGDDGKRWVSQIPVSAIREMDADSGEGKFIGEVTIRRRVYESVTDPVERKRLQEENEALKAGDPRIEWAFGFYLSPTRRGRGIMPAVVRTLLNDFLIPHMNVHHISCAFLEHNPASRRVFEKSGFSFVKIYPDVVELPEAKTGVKGKKVGLGVVKWDREGVRKEEFSA